jgi:dipeptidyl aminopeptidase/acylaminoacyl peptidase
MLRWASCFFAAFAVFGAAHAQPVDVARYADPVSARSASLSPDGSHLAYIHRTDADERLIVVDLNAGAGRPIQRIARAEGFYAWVEWKNNTRLLYSAILTETVEGRAATGTRRVSADQDYETSSVLAINRDGTGFVQMFEGQLRSLRGSTALIDPLRDDPNTILLMAQDSSGVGVWRADVNTGRVERVARGPDETYGYITDGAGYPVIRMDVLNDNSGYRILRRASGAEDWAQVVELRRATAATNSPDFNVIASGPAANQVYVLARQGQADLASLYLYNTATGEYGAPLFTPTAADADAPWVHPTTRSIMATCEFTQRLLCSSTDADIQRHISAVDAFFERQATFRVVDASDDGNRWLLEVNGPAEPGGYYLFDRARPNIRPVANMYPSLVDGAVSPVEVISYQSRDGASLWAYVTRANTGAAGPRPMIVMPHGGPESRDHYGYDAFAQFLASRGYIVLQPNFRGSYGFGRAFADAGRGQWGRMMQDDVTDAVRHMIATGQADAQRVCVVGASYGGYVALAGAAMTPDMYRCAISIAGPSDLPEAVLRTSQRGSATRHYWLRSIGDPGADRAALDAISPRHLASQITAPVLLIHGEEDDVVEIRQSELMAQAMQRRARLVRLPEEGHFWDDWTRESRLTVFRETEAFLREHNPP